VDLSIQKSIFWRSLLLQACWSFEGRQNLGFLMALEPMLKHIYPDQEEYRAAAIRHMGCFNTQPYAAGCVLGVTAGMESQRAQMPEAERKAYEKKIQSMKTSLSTAVAAVGDTFFWGSLKPACAAWTILIWLVLWLANAPHPIFLGALFYFSAYNAPALWARWKGIEAGYRRRADLVADLGALNWQKRARWIRRAGWAAAVIILISSILVPPWGGVFGVEPVAVFVAAFVMRRFGITPAKAYACAVMAGAVGAMAL
jgi:mannose/fructose/N-acetylgalactosamine-specific phosphotransferase system component IID